MLGLGRTALFSVFSLWQIAISVSLFPDGSELDLILQHVTLRDFCTACLNVHFRLSAIRLWEV